MNAIYREATTHRWGIACLAALMCGCASIPADPSRMSADQLRELSKDRSASAACSAINTPWGPARTVFVQLDQKSIVNGSVTVGQDCVVTVNNTQKVETPDAAKAKAGESLSCYRSGGAIVCEPLK